MDIAHVYHLLVGTGPRTIDWWQMMVRGAVIFAYGLVLLRIANTRAFGRNATFDLLLSVILGSVLSRALTANAELLPTMAATGLLVVLHRVFSQIAFRWHGFGAAIKGRVRPLAAAGTLHRDQMRRAAVTENDLLEAARLNGLTRLEEIEEAYLERNGEITVFPRRRV